MAPSVCSCSLLAARGGRSHPNCCASAPILQQFLSFHGRDGGGAPAAAGAKCEDNASSGGSGGKLSFKWEDDSCLSAPVVYSLLSFASAHAGSMEQQTPYQGHRNYNYNYINGYMLRLSSLSQKSLASEACRMAQWITMDSDYYFRLEIALSAVRKNVRAPPALVASPTGQRRLRRNLPVYHGSWDYPLLGHYLGFYLSSGHVQAMLMARTRKCDAMFRRININSFGRAKAVYIRSQGLPPTLLVVVAASSYSSIGNLCKVQTERVQGEVQSENRVKVLLGALLYCGDNRSRWKKLGKSQAETEGVGTRHMC